MKQDLVAGYVSRALFNSDLIATRVTLAIAELLWAITLLWPGDIFHRPAYQLMAMLGTETTWGLVFLLSGIIQMSIALLGCTDTKFAKWFSLWNCILWMYTVIAMYLTVYPPPAAISGEAALALASFWVWAKPLVVQKGEIYAARETTIAHSG